LLNKAISNTKLTEFRNLVISRSFQNQSSVNQSISHWEMFLNIFSKRKPLRKPLHYLIEFNRIVWWFFMLIFALENTKTNI